MNYSIDEIKTFLLVWGTGFKSLIGTRHELAEAYYQACVDAHLHLSQKPMRFFTVGGLRRTLLLIADEFMAEYTSRRQDATYRQRAELITYIANHLLQSLNTEWVQKELF